ncbi:MAG: hypothetical protein Crog4KO_33370 [Crocinitomicaceae bacterium]
MGTFQIIALCTGAVEVVYILLVGALNNSKNWKALLLLFSLALYNAVFLTGNEAEFLNVALSFTISFFYLEQSFSNIGYSESESFKKYIWLSAIASIGFIVTLSFSITSSSTLTLLTPFLLIQNFLIFAVVKTVLERQSETLDEISTIYSNVFCVAILSGCFLIKDKQLASYLVTNGFFLLLTLQPFVQRIFSASIAMRNEAEKYNSLDELFDEWYLTPTEQEIAKLLIEGKSTSEIANAKFIEASTVRKHISNLMGKANVNHRQDFLTTVKSHLSNHSEM